MTTPEELLSELDQDLHLRGEEENERQYIIVMGPRP